MPDRRRRRYLLPRVEPEVGFLLGADLHRRGAARQPDVLDATEAVAPALELIDSRIADWKIGLVDTDRRQRVVGRLRR